MARINSYARRTRSIGDDMGVMLRESTGRNKGGSKKRM